MKKINHFLLPVLALSLPLCCQQPEQPEEESYDSLEGLVINEVVPGKTMFTEFWLEIYNPTSTARDLKGLKVILTSTQVMEEPVLTLDSGRIEAGGYFVISSKDHEFSSPMIMATFEEVAIADHDGIPVNAFSIKYDYHYSGKVEEGESYARIPDGKGEWTITGTPSPLAANYKITPHAIKGLVINEVCPAQHWVELVNTSRAELQLEYSYIKNKAGAVVYTAPSGETLPSGGRITVDCEGSDADFAELKYCSNTGESVATFSAGTLATPPSGGSWSRLPDITGKFDVSSTATKGEENYSVSASETGLVINEVAKNWVEVANSTLSDIKAGSVKLYGVKSGAETLVKTFTNQIFKSHAGEAVDATFDSYVLKGSDGTVLDSFKASDVRDAVSLDATSSWSRLPDGTGNFYTVVTPSRGGANYGIQQGNSIALWVNHSSMGSIDLDQMCRLGIGNIVIHEYVFRPDLHSISDVNAFFAKAHSLGMKIHIWMQCFWWNDSTGWRSAVIDRNGDTPARYNQELFDEIIGRAMSYVRYDIDGIHFDYIRFGGTAGKHNFPDDGITGTGAITEFCRQISGKLRAAKPGIVLSAALMGEAGAVGSYGQDPAQMNAYIDVFMPMAYISSYKYSSVKNVSVANWFAARRGTSQVWHGFSTYDANTVGLSPETLTTQIRNIVDNADVQGLAFFRYGIGELPDLNEYYKK